MSLFVSISLKVLTAIEEANEAQKHVLAMKIRAHLGVDLSGRHFALRGLAFKASTDDMREATSRSAAIARNTEFGNRST